MTGKKFAILRFQKIKTVQQLSAHSNHISRSKETPNADTDNIAKQPMPILGSGDHATDVKDALQTLSKKPRKNATIAIEALLTASPEWLRKDGPPGSYDAERVVQLTKAAKAFLAEQFPNCPISATLHLDESTPHIHATIVPLDDTPPAKARRRGPVARLNASRWLDGPEKLSALQDAWHDATASLGLDRGVKGSKAKHEKIQRLYGSLERNEQIASSKAVEAEAFSAGVEAWASGKIVGASLDNNGKATLTLKTQPEEANELKKAIKPAFARVWQWVADKSKEIQTRQQQALKAVNDMLNNARDLAPHLDDAGRNRAAKLAHQVKTQSQPLKTKNGPEGR